MADDGLKKVVNHLFSLAARAEFATYSDQQLLQRYAEQRDELAFGELMRRHGPMVWKVCWRVLRHSQDTEEAFQATFTTLLRRISSMVWRDAIDGWLHNVAYKVATKAQVMRERCRAREERRAKMRNENSESGACRWELAEVLDKELSYLPERYRCPLILCYLEGLTWSQAAQKLGISLRTLEWRLSQGRERLRKRLNKYGIDLGAMTLLASVSADIGIPEMPAGLIDKTMALVRVLIQANGVLETAGISTEIAMLAKGALGIWSVKTKIGVAVLLLCLTGIGTGMATHPGYFLQLIRWNQPQKTQPNPASRVTGNTQVNRTLPPRLDRYGDPLPPQALARLGTTRLRHIGMAWRSVAELVTFARDGKSLFTAGSGSALRQWDVATGKLLQQFGAKNQRFRQIALSPDGKILAAISHQDGGRIFLWDITTGKLLRQWASWVCFAMVFSPDGKTLTAPCTGRCIRTWEVATGKELRAQTMDDPFTQAFVLSPTGKIMASLYSDQNNDSMIQLWDITIGKELYHLPPVKGAPFSIAIPSVAFSSDGNLLATTSATIDHNTINFQIGSIEPTNGSVHVWEVATGKKIRSIGSDKAGTSCVAFSPDGQLLATGSVGGPIRLWEVATGKELRSCQGYRAHVCALAFSPDGTRLASSASGNDQATRVWEIGTGKELTPCLGGHTAPVLSLTFTPDGQSLVSGGRDGQIGIWDPETGRERQSFLRAGDYQAFAGVSMDGKTIVSVGNIFMPNGGLYPHAVLASPTIVRLWDIATGKERRFFAGSSGCVQSLAISPDARKLITVNLQWPGTAAIPGRQRLLDIGFWNTTTGKQFGGDIRNLMHYQCAAFSPDNQVFAVCAGNGSLSLREATTGKELDHYQGYTMAFGSLAATFSPDGQLLATVGQNVVLGNQPWSNPLRNAIRLWHFRSGKKRILEEGPTLIGHEGEIFALAFSPDGRTIASAGDNGTLYLWETATGKERCRFTGHHGQIWCLAFSSDGYRLASGSNDTTILIWDVTGRLENGQPRRAWLSARQVQQRWTDLASTDAHRAGQAIWSLVAAPDTAVAFLKKKLAPIPIEKGLGQRIARLVEQLDDDRFQIREQAASELRRLGEASMPALRGVLQSPASVEAKKRAKHLLTAIKEKKTNEDYRRIRALEVLEKCGMPAARQLLKALAQGEPTAALTREAQAALARLLHRATSSNPK